MFLRSYFVFKSYAILMEFFSGTLSSSSEHSLSTSPQKLMQILSGASLVLQYTFLTQFLFKLAKFLSGTSLLLQYTPLIHSSSNIEVSFPFLVQFAYPIFLQNRLKKK